MALSDIAPIVVSGLKIYFSLIQRLLSKSSAMEELKNDVDGFSPSYMILFSRVDFACEAVQVKSSLA